LALLYAGFAWHALPNLVGRSVERPRALRAARQTAVFASLTALLMVVSGLTAGYTWAGGAFTGTLVAVGEGWSATMGLSNILFGLAILTGVGGLLAQLSISLTLYRTLTSGRATVQEVLVESGGDHD
jgi:hypothetical protein